MQLSRSSLVWGLTLLALGGLLLAQNLNLLRAPVPVWAVVFGGLGLLFLLTALFNRSLWGLLIPGSILFGLAVVIFLSEGNVASGNVIGAVFLASVALPFWIIALIRRANWWAIIPAGAVSVLAAMPLLAESRVSGQIVGGVFFLGLGVTFALVRLATVGRPGMGWAWYPAVILGAIGLIVLASGDARLWPWVLIGGGVLLLLRSIVPVRRA